jgi:hypothetical protein
MIFKAIYNVLLIPFKLFTGSSQQNLADITKETNDFINPPKTIENPKEIQLDQKANFQQETTDNTLKPIQEAKANTTEEALLNIKPKNNALKNNSNLEENNSFVE